MNYKLQIFLNHKVIETLLKLCLHLSHNYVFSKTLIDNIKKTLKIYYRTYFLNHIFSHTLEQARLVYNTVK